MAGGGRSAFSWRGSSHSVESPQLDHLSRYEDTALLYTICGLGMHCATGRIQATSLVAGLSANIHLSDGDCDYKSAAFHGNQRT